MLLLYILKKFNLFKLYCFSLVNVEDKMKIYLEYQEKFSRSQTPQRRPLDFTSGKYYSLFVKCTHTSLRASVILNYQIKTSLVLNWAAAVYYSFANKCQLFCFVSYISSEFYANKYVFKNMVHWFVHHRSC